MKGAHTRTASTDPLGEYNIKGKAEAPGSGPRFNSVLTKKL